MAEHDALALVVSRAELRRIGLDPNEQDGSHPRRMTASEAREYARSFARKHLHTVFAALLDIVSNSRSDAARTTAAELLVKIAAQPDETIQADTAQAGALGAQAVQTDELVKFIRSRKPAAEIK